ncbi:tissue factor pathway inhibitor a isoform 2-T2 [Clarias gariepinus]|uniref:tissue factor pathway inhibitor a isoform X2 n=1 Tax=Clarias gariepinus TaxID=13013 RepID=UPI00234D8D16|nr:tissue factor pathway inhibitor a isoform X2 [Clarias gariepinus]
MASLHSCCLTVLFVCLGFCHSVIKEGVQHPLKIFHQNCALKKDEGPCKAIIPKFYFDIETGKCEEFEYGGCQGNENNFQSKEECETFCLVKDYKSPCHLVDEPGPCRALVPRFFFDSKTKECRRFFYGGCLGNANNFQTLKECRHRCLRNHTKEPQDSLEVKELSPLFTKTDVHSVSESHMQPRKLPRPESNKDTKIETHQTRQHFSSLQLSNFDVHSVPASPTLPQKLSRPESNKHTKFVLPDQCQRPLDPGTCVGSEERFFYDSEAHKCLPFNYTGCGGNKNNFEHKRQCIRTCMKGSKKSGKIRIKSKTANVLFRLM